MYEPDNDDAASLIHYLLYLGDNALVLSQRNSAWCGHGPVLEQDIAITNISLDLIGQARSFYQYAASLEGKEVTEDTLAYLRGERAYYNCLLLELPNGDWGHTILRQFFFSVFQQQLYKQLLPSKDSTIAAIAEKSLKEVAYHVRWSSEWVIRLGDGTEESQARMEKALVALWAYTGEFFQPAEYELAAAREGIGPVVAALQPGWWQQVQEVLAEATLQAPEQGKTWMQTGGKTGRHTEHMGYLLAEMQYLQRAYPGATW
ncbi:1,2-phenylacetyl-CoA epoxidase subunit PaaC [Paraflavitalea pollutisoli]|uniref:1,2-phenylacetyl-CoA epoxidase subunit PaaC n=1 Tax=Paraflavitalea pollutisoli TaxID=3034143 RepID=UPI0023ED1199|nr:1,2-phenylacetyl-CoA epoxidase subunit PaaC [Paraflavitalea sp. H1-2-19X]